MKDLNFLPQSVLKERKTQEFGKLIKAIFILFIAGNLLLIVMPIVQGKMLDQKDRELQAQIKQYDQDKARHDEIEKIRAANTPKNNAKAKIAKDENTIKYSLEQVEECFPSGVSTTSIQLEIDGNTNIVCAANNILGLSDFLNNLRRTNKFENIELLSTTMDGSAGKVQFAVKFKIKKQGV